MQDKIYMNANEFDWSEGSEIKVVKLGKEMVEIQLNRKGIKDLIAILQFMLDEPIENVHFDSWGLTGPLADGSLELSIWLKDTIGK